MYFYLYDSFLSEKRHERELAAVEARLTDLGLSGKISRLTPFNNARGLVRDEVRRGATSIVAVGNDETVSKVIDGLGEMSVTLGIIPIGGPNSIADALGIPGGVDACETLSRRVAQKVDLGSANGHLFLSEVRIAGEGITAETDGSFRLTVLAPGAEIVVSNMRNREMADGLAPERAGDPMDGLLDLLVVNRSSGGLLGRWRQDVDVTVIPTRQALFTAPQPFAVLCDGREFSTDSLAVSIVPDRLKIITGRERVFANEETAT
jgi:diacylglycerol kinase family enzyme